MATQPVYNMNKQEVGSIDLDDAVFGGEVKEHLFYEVVRSQLATRRAGTHCTKGRAEVHGHNKKPYKQKGTGQARQGDVKSPTSRGGGVVFGPKPRDYGFQPPKKVRRAALRSALARRLQDARLWIIDSLELQQIKTKDVATVAGRFGWNSALIVDEKNDRFNKSARNLPKVDFIAREGLNVYDILRHEHLVITKAAVQNIIGALSK
jgi:large subunit ribosomal protein L4